MNFVKKNMIVIIIIMIIILSVCGISVYAAYKYFAEDVNYTTKDGTEISVDEALNELYEKSNSVTEDLLWTNPYPNSAYGAQTVALDLSQYKYVLIDATYGGNGLKSNDCKKQKTCVEVGTSNVITGTHNYGYASTTRTATVSTTGVTFSTGRWYNGRDVSSNNYAVPLHIWGIK